MLPATCAFCPILPCLHHHYHGTPMAAATAPPRPAATASFATPAPRGQPRWTLARSRRHHRPAVRAAAAAYQQQQDAGSQAFEQLRDWLTQRGGSVGPITAGDCRMGPVTVRGLVAREDLGPGTPLLSVPISAALRDDRAGEPFPGAAWNACLAAQLLAERDRGASSAWAPYLATLPATACCPLLLADHQLREVQYAPAMAAIQEYQAAAREAYAAFVRQQRQQQYSWEEWVWALHLVQSRSIRLAITGCKVMIPGIDLLNHGGAAANGQLVLGKASWKVEGEPAVCFVTTQPMRAGEQVLWSYGERSNDDFFAYHGFVLGANPHEDAVLFGSVAQLVAWVLQHVPGLQRLQGQQEHALRDVAEAAAARAAQAAAAHCSSAAIPGTTSSLLAPLTPLLQQLAHAGPDNSRSSSGGRAGAREAAVLAAYRRAELQRRLASFRLHRPEWGDASACPPATTELVLRRDGSLDVRLPAVLAALFDAADAAGSGSSGSSGSDGGWPAALQAAVAERCRELLAGMQTSVADDERLLKQGGGTQDELLAAVVQYRLAKKALLREWAEASGACECNE